MMGRYEPTAQESARVSRDRLLVLDMGSSSVRASLYKETGEPLPGRDARTPQRWRRDEAGEGVLDAEALLAAVAGVVDEILAELKPGERVVAVGAATLAGSLVGLNAQGEAVTPIYTYADTRSGEAASRLKARLESPAEVVEETGCPFHAAYWPAQLEHLSTHNPGLVARVARWCDLSSFLYGRLFGTPQPMSLSVASWTGLLDRFENAWSRTLLSALSLNAAHLPELVDVDDAARGLAPQWAARWPALRGADFHPALGDGAAANLGSAGFADDALVVTIGSTSAARVTVRGAPPRPRGGWAYRVDAAHSLLGGALSEGGSGYAWLRARLRLPPEGELETLLAALPPAAHGLTVLPLLRGERAPGWRADATGALVGLREETTTVDIVRAWLEGTAYRLAEVVERLPERPRIIASGGALGASRVWQGILSDVLLKPLYPVADAEVTSLGVAFALARARNLDPSPSALAAPVEPNKSHHEVYREARAAQRALYALRYGGEA